MVKPLSAGCVNVVVACSILITSDYVSQVAQGKLTRTRNRKLTLCGLMQHTHNNADRVEFVILLTYMYASVKFSLLATRFIVSHQHPLHLKPATSTVIIALQAMTHPF